MSIPVYAKMILWAHVETECETVLYSKQFDKLLTNCFTTGSELTAEAEENGYGKTEFGQDAAIRPSVEEEAIFVQSYKSRARVTLTLRNYDDIGHRQLRVTIGLRITWMTCEMRTDQNSNTRRLRPTDGLQY